MHHLPPAARERIADVLADHGLTLADLAPTVAQSWRSQAAMLLDTPSVDADDAAVLRRVIAWRNLPDDYRSKLSEIAARHGFNAEA